MSASESANSGEKGQFQPIKEAQSQEGPTGFVVVISNCYLRCELTRGISTEVDMNPTSEATKLEGPGKFYEYMGVGKLRNYKALITGGE